MSNEQPVQEMTVPRCPRCGATNPAGQRFCGNCGISLGSQVLRKFRRPSQWGTALLTVGCIIVATSTFLEWGRNWLISGSELTSGFGLVSLVLSMLCLGLTYMEITRGRFSHATSVGQLVLATLAAIPWFLWLISFEPNSPNAVVPGLGFYLAGIGFLLWFVGAVWGWSSRAVSAVGIFLAILLFAVTSCAVWWQVSEDKWTQWFTTLQVKPVAEKYRSALLAGDWDTARSMYCSVDCLQTSCPHRSSADEVLHDHAVFFREHAALTWNVFRPTDRNAVIPPYLRYPWDLTTFKAECDVPYPAMAQDPLQLWTSVTASSGTYLNEWYLELWYSRKSRCLCTSTLYEQQ
jgi:hypothetical protein